MHCAPFLLTMQIIFASVSYRRVVADLRLFNQTGNWYSTSWEIRQNELPEAVNNTLNNQYGEYRFDEAEYIEKADGSIYYRIELEKGDVDKVVNIGENGTVLS